MRRQAFTLTELMVAIVIMAVLLLLINQLFITTSGAISTGIKSSELLIDAEVIGKQIEDDFERMMGPSGDREDGGFLVIVQHAIPNVEMVARSGQFGSQNINLEFIRSDQIIFITQGKEGKKIRSITPQDGDSYGSDIRAQYARVRYGHLARVDPESGNPDVMGEGQNRWANNWLLGRHETLLAGDDPNVIANPGAWHESIGWGPAGDPIRESVQDVVDQIMWDDRPRTDPPVAPRGLLSVLEWADNPPTRQYYEPLLDPAYDGAFAATPGRIPSAMPDVPLDNGQLDFNPSSMARMHPVLSSHVSDFIVEFAGDYDTASEGELDRDSDGNIIWYAFDPEDATSNWYVHGDGIQDNRVNVDPEHPDHPEPGLLRPVVHAFPTTGAHMANMFLLDANELDNQFPNAYTDTATAMFVWRHDDENDEAWPWLIRIRYRMHDSDGRIEGEAIDEFDGRAQELGQWLEHIVSVPGPRK